MCFSNTIQKRRGYLDQENTLACLRDSIDKIWSKTWSCRALEKCIFSYSIAWTGIQAAPDLQETQKKGSSLYFSASRLIWPLSIVVLDRIVIYYYKIVLYSRVNSIPNYQTLSLNLLVCMFVVAKKQFEPVALATVRFFWLIGNLCTLVYHASLLNIFSSEMLATCLLQFKVMFCQVLSHVLQRIPLTKLFFNPSSKMTCL